MLGDKKKKNTALGNQKHFEDPGEGRILENNLMQHFSKTSLTPEPRVCVWDPKQRPQAVRMKLERALLRSHTGHWDAHTWDRLSCYCKGLTAKMILETKSTEGR